MHTYTYSMGATPKTDSGTLNWNPNGTLLSLAITDQINTANTQTCNYTHDGLGRIASANCGTTIFNQNFTYDPFGNITKTVPNGSTGTAFQPNYDYTNYTNRMTSTPFTYNNNNGALTNDGSHAYGWDTNNRLSTVDSGGSGGLCITYDALDRVVEQATGSTCSTSYKQIVYSPGGAKLALMNSSTLLNAFISLPGGAQAVYNGPGLLFYRHPDWLGSSRLATTPNRSCYWDVAYAPFGENYVPPVSGCVQQDLNFTGQNQDTVQSVPSGGQGGLYDFMFRKHSPVQGRWLSPDPSGIASADPSDPQTWNRYAYVANRPTNTVDRLGLDSCDSIIGPCICDPDGFCCNPDDPNGCNCVASGTEGCIPFPPGGGGGGGGGGSGGGGGAPPGLLPRQGGVWANNETLGLPGGLSTPLLDVNGLLGLMDPCGRTTIATFGMGVIATSSDSNTAQTKVPCLVVVALAVVGAVLDRPKANDNSGSCDAHTSGGAAFQDLCTNHLGNGWISDTAYTCEGNGNQGDTTEKWCCLKKAEHFDRWCDSRNFATKAPDASYRFQWVEDDVVTGGRKEACCMHNR
jgi:RHS repeat-associated protein